MEEINKEKIKKILCINFGGIGDEILFLPTILSLKKEFPDAKITLALEPRSKGIKSLTNKIDDLFLVDIKNGNKYIELLKFIWKARFSHFDLAVTAGGNKFMSIILALTGIKLRYGYDTGELSRKLLTKAVKLHKQQYACDMYHDLITPITEIKTYLPEIDLEEQEKMENTVLIHPGVSKMSVQKGMIKTIPAKKWATVIDFLLENGKKVILAGGPDDDECIKTIKETMSHIGSENFIDYYGKTKSLLDLAKLIARAEKFVCSDSAPLHIAVAVKTKTYVVFGPTDDLKLIPRSNDVIPLKAKDECDLKPCLWDRRQTTCENPVCLDLSPIDIADKILGL
jgi:ADP-heptose:LPS heptosyltransferase